MESDTNTLDGRDPAPMNNTDRSMSELASLEPLADSFPDVDDDLPTLEDVNL